VVLPDYFITVEMLDTGLNQGANMAAAKSIAQQTLDGLERAGLLSQAAPDIESGKPAADPAPKDSAPATASPAGVRFCWKYTWTIQHHGSGDGCCRFPD